MTPHGTTIMMGFSLLKSLNFTPRESALVFGQSVDSVRAALAAMNHLAALGSPEAIRVAEALFSITQKLTTLCGLEKDFRLNKWLATKDDALRGKTPKGIMLSGNPWRAEEFLTARIKALSEIAEE